MTGQALPNAQPWRYWIALDWWGEGSSSETGQQVSTRGLPCKTQPLPQNQLKIQCDKGGIPQLLSPMASQHRSGLYQHLFSLGCPLGRWSSNLQGRGPQLLEKTCCSSIGALQGLLLTSSFLIWFPRSSYLTKWISNHFLMRVSF